MVSLALPSSTRGVITVIEPSVFTENSTFTGAFTATLPKSGMPHSATGTSKSVFSHLPSKLPPKPICPPTRTWGVRSRAMLGLPPFHFASATSLVSAVE
ncbi:MAG: hypothetical protein HOO96_21195 [Polyangiaceae bacterium]|nr:hypothetical protein [Polyangiaceae bacterium]